MQTKLLEFCKKSGQQPPGMTDTWAVAIEALVLTALPPHRSLNTAGQAVAHNVVLWLPPHLLITPLMAVVAGCLVMAVR